MTDPPVYDHDPIEEIQPDVFMVRGCIKMNALMTITRNMAIVRHAGELTLVDPIRLSAAEEKRLDALGAVRRILRLGSMHGVDDPYYIERYGAELWAPGLSEAFPEPKPTLTFDAIQNYGDYRYNNLVARLMMPLIGFSKTTLVGPLWVKAMTPKGASLESEFRRLLELEFDQLLSAHGSLVKTGAHEACERAVDKMFSG